MFYVLEPLSKKDGAIIDQATSLGNAEISAVIEFAKVISGT